MNTRLWGGERGGALSYNWINIGHRILWQANSSMTLPSSTNNRLGTSEQHTVACLSHYHLRNTLEIEKKNWKQIYANSVDLSGCSQRCSMLLVCTVCHSISIFLTYKETATLYCSKFRVHYNILAVQFFWILMMVHFKDNFCNSTDVNTVQRPCHNKHWSTYPWQCRGRHNSST